MSGAIYGTYGEFDVDCVLAMGARLQHRGPMSSTR